MSFSRRLSAYTQFSRLLALRNRPAEPYRRPARKPRRTMLMVEAMEERLTPALTSVDFGPGNYTFNWPAGVTQATVQVWGAGGNGGDGMLQFGMGGGGGGGYVSAEVLRPSSGTSEIGVYAGGSGNDSGNGSTYAAWVDGEYFGYDEQITAFNGSNAITSGYMDGAAGGSYFTDLFFSTLLTTAEGDAGGSGQMGTYGGMPGGAGGASATGAAGGAGGAGGATGLNGQPGAGPGGGGGGGGGGTFFTLTTAEFGGSLAFNGWDDWIDSTTGYEIAASGSGGWDLTVGGSTWHSDTSLSGVFDWVSGDPGDPATVTVSIATPLGPTGVGGVGADGRVRITYEAVPAFAPINTLCSTDPTGGSNVGAGPKPPPYTDAPVRYADGVISLSSTDLSSAGAAGGTGLTRSWSNNAQYAGAVTDYGNGWVVADTPHLTQLDPGSDDTVVAVSNATTARFYDLSGGDYAGRFGDTNVLTHDTTNHLFVLTLGGGGVYTFYDFDSSYTDAAQRGRFRSYTTAAGDATAVTSLSDGLPTEVQSTTAADPDTIVSYVYTYVSGGTNDGKVASVTLRQSTDGGSTWATVRSVEYAYYGTSDDNGNAGDLERATVKDADGNPVSTDYYRYYTEDVYDGDTQVGYRGGLKYAVLGASYDQLKAFAGGTDGDVDGADDEDVAAYADHYFEYDRLHRVTTEVASAAGCSVCANGQGTYQLSYTASTNSPGYNSWATKTVETLPDGNTNTVYTNAYGEVMLLAYTDTAASQTWLTYYQYDAAGRLVLQADPSAVTGYDDNYADLVHYVSGNAAYLSDSAGLLTQYVYGSSTTATDSTDGDVDGFLAETDLLHGETGTLGNGRLVPQSSQTYIVRTANDQDFYFPASSTVYRNDDGTGGQTTTYSYTWQGSTAQPASMTATLPTVATGQNGSNAATSAMVVLDAQGRVVWSKDAGGFISYTEYDPATGAVVRTIQDVDDGAEDIPELPDGWETPSGGGLHLTTTYEVDSQGRTTKVTYPDGTIDYTVYDDADHEVRTYSGWNSTTNRPSGPTVVTREDWAGGYTETLTMSAAPAVSSGRPTGAEGISQVQSLSRSYTNAAGQVVYSDDYFNLAGLTYSTSTSLGTSGVNFDRTSYVYDARGRLAKTVSPLGTITRTVYDGQGRAVSEWVGTDDTPTTGYWSPTNLTGTDMVKVREYEYDGGGVGDGNLTSVTEYPGGGADPRVTETYYDWRDRAVATKSGVQVSEDTGVNRPITYVDYDNLGEVTKTRVYDGDGVSISTSGGVPVAPSSSLLRAQTTTSYDELGRAYRTDTYSVDPADGTVGSYTLYSLTWYDANGQVVKTVSPGGLVTKYSYDGAGRITTTYLTDGGGDSTYSDALSVTGDTVLEQDETQYDAGGKILVSTTRQRFHDASGTGALGTPSTGVYARVSYTAYYYDAGGRLVETADVGTNGGTAFGYDPESVPSRDADHLVTTYDYAADFVQDIWLTGAVSGGTFTLTVGGDTTSGIAYNASASTVQSALESLGSVGSENVAVTATAGGWEVRFTGDLAGTYMPMINGNPTGLSGGGMPAVYGRVVSAGGDTGGAAAVTDPQGRVSRTYQDNLGRTVRSIENFTDGVVTADSNKTTDYTYNAAGMASLTARLVGGGGQTTAWVYGVTAGTGSAITSNDIVGATEYPDPTTGAASSGEKESVTVNALGQTVTSTDRNGTTHTLTYDVLGRVVSDEVTHFGTGVDDTVVRIDTAYDGQGNAYLVTSYDGDDNVVNQVLREFNGLGQLTAEYQSHDGEVDTETTPAVLYAYSAMPGGANHSRLVSITYPSGYELDYNYASGLDSTISRLSSLSDTTGTLEAYSYLGLGTVVIRSHPQVGVAGLDLTYVKQGLESVGDAGDQYTGLDRFGRVVDQRWLDVDSGDATDEFQYGYDAGGNRLYRDNLVNAAFGEVYTYDGLNQLASFARGTLNGTKDGIDGSAATTSDWTYDALGNWSGVSVDGDPATTRTANAQNEITSIDGATTPTYDANGNMTGDETGRKFVYDAWNRLVRVTDSENNPLVAYTYDGLNRRVTRDDGTATDLYYSSQWQVLEEQQGGDTTARYVWSPVYVDAMVLRDRATTTPGTLDERLWVQQDANWNVTALVDGSGAVVERYAYDPFGAVTVLTGAFGSRGSSSYGWVYLHQGLRWDGTATLYDNYGRWYSPSLGRFTSLDPLGFWAGDQNQYRYVANNPGNWVDPSGLDGRKGPYDYFGEFAEWWMRDHTVRLPLPPPRGPFKYEPLSMEAVSEADARTRRLLKDLDEKEARDRQLQRDIREYTFSFGWLPAPGGGLPSGGGLRANYSSGRSPLPRPTPGTGRIPLPMASGFGRGPNGRPMFPETWEALLTERYGAGNVQRFRLFRGVNDILTDPTVLTGWSPGQVELIVGNTPGWRIETLGQGAHAGQGWVLREYSPNGQPTGRMLRWHPGGGHHGPDPYWRVTCGGGQGENSGIIPAGQ